MQLKSTTRHIRIYTAILEDNELVPSNDLLTIDIDPDNELNWNDESVKQVYAKFDQLVDAYEGEDLTEYNLRRIGSELEHLVPIAPPKRPNQLQPQQPRCQLQHGIAPS